MILSLIAFQPEKLESLTNDFASLKSKESIPPNMIDIIKRKQKSNHNKTFPISLNATKTENLYRLTGIATHDLLSQKNIDQASFCLNCLLEISDNLTPKS